MFDGWILAVEIQKFFSVELASVVLSQWDEANVLRFRGRVAEWSLDCIQVMCACDCNKIQGDVTLVNL